MVVKLCHNVGRCVFLWFHLFFFFFPSLFSPPFFLLLFLLVEYYILFVVIHSLLFIRYSSFVILCLSDAFKCDFSGIRIFSSGAWVYSGYLLMGMVCWAKKMNQSKLWKKNIMENAMQIITLSEEDLEMIEDFVGKHDFICGNATINK